MHSGNVDLPNRVANYLSQANVEDIESELQHCLHLVGLELEVSQVTLAKRRANELSCLYDWHATGLLATTLNIDLCQADWLRDQLDEGEDILIDDIRELPDLAAFEADVFGTRRLGALAGVTANAADSLYLFAEVQNRTRKWSSTEINILGEVGQHVGAALTRRREQIQLVATAREAGRDSAQKSHFIATLAHELRTPLTAIIGYSQLLAVEAAGPLTAKQTQFLGDILSCAEHLERIVNESLDLAKIDAGRMTLSIEECSVSQLVEAALATVRAAANKKGIELISTLPPKPITIRVDSVKMRQVLINLLTNAVKFTEEGSVSITVEEGANELIVVIRDTGAGISENNISRIFESFARVFRSQSNDEGTGLGLALVKRLVDLHGGSIDVTSILGEGSCFRLKIPQHSHAAIAGRPIFVVGASS